jgi:hypothetical protein
MQKIPVLVTFFNRPSHLETLLISLKKFPDTEIYFSSDGPRNPDDRNSLERCFELIDRYFGNIPKSHLLRRENNLGCKNGMKNNIDWFFDQVSYGIILEDDCIPNDNFIKLTGKVLSEHVDNPLYMSINGTNSFSKLNSKHLFRETHFPMVWGWGTWGKQWGKYQLEIPDAEEIVDCISDEIYGPNFSIKKMYFENVFKTRFLEVENGRIDTWDYSLTASAWRHKLKSLQFNFNSIINIGFDESATHTINSKPKWVPTTYAEIQNLNQTVQPIDSQSELWIIEKVFGAGFKQLIKNKIKSIIR